MTQTFEVFQGLPLDLKNRLDVIKGLGGNVVQVVTTSVSANYLIIWEM